MKEFQGKTAVITGAANGFGKEFAKEAARRGMKIVLADIDQNDLVAAVNTVQDLGAEATGVCADVSLYEEMQRVVRTAVDTYGSVDLMINNAGVYYVGTVADMPARDFQWMFDANVLSVFYGMKEAIPQMLKQDTPCHILNVASLAGFVAMRSMSTYHAAKHAVVAASESTFLDLQAAKAKIGMSIFCPGYVQTDLNHCERHRPARYQAPDDPYYQSDTYKKNVSLVDRFIETGAPIDNVAETCFKAIENDQFYILPVEEFGAFIKRRHENIQTLTNPDVNKLN